MPHLSPMNWLSAILSLTLILFMLMTLYWWTPSPKFKSIKNSSSQVKTKWTW